MRTTISIYTQGGQRRYALTMTGTRFAPDESTTVETSSASELATAIRARLDGSEQRRALDRLDALEEYPPAESYVEELADGRVAYIHDEGGAPLAWVERDGASVVDVCGGARMVIEDWPAEGTLRMAATAMRSARGDLAGLAARAGEM